MEEQQPLQQPQLVITNGIQQSMQEHPEKVCIHGNFNVAITQVSIQFLVDYLQGDTGGQNVTELELDDVRLSSPSDGGLDALCTLFANSERLIDVILDYCDFGGEDDSRRVLESFHNNPFVTKLTFTDAFVGLRGAAFGACLSQLLQNNPALVYLRLDCFTLIGVEVIRALLPGIQTLKFLHIYDCDIRDEGLGLIAASLVGNTTMLELDVTDNFITSNGVIQHVTTLLKSTRIQKIDLEHNHFSCNAQSLQHLHDALVNNLHLLRLELEDHRVANNFPQQVAAIEALLARNRHWNHARSLLTAGVRPGTRPIPRTSGVWPVAIAQWSRATDGSFPGTNAIYHVLQSRPILLQPPIAPPPRPQQQQQQQPLQQPLQQAQDDSDDDFPTAEQAQAAVAAPERVDYQSNDDRDDDAGVQDDLGAEPAAAARYAQRKEGRDDAILAALRECRQLQPRINQLGHPTWENEIRGHLFSYVDSEGANRAAFTRAVNLLEEYERRMAENAAEELQDHQLVEQLQPSLLQPAAAAAAAADHGPDDDNDTDNINQEESSSSRDRKRQRLL